MPHCQAYGCVNDTKQKMAGVTLHVFPKGIVSLVSLSILSYERYATVLRCTKADISDYRKSWLCIGGSWLYSFLWTVPPFLGWSSYGPEGAGTSCSVQWHQRSPNSISYVVCLFIFCLLLPLMLMVFCYSRILLAVRGVAKINLTSAQRRENHILLMVVSMVTCYLLCWMPYGVVALVATFGRMGLINPVASIVPSILAKSSTVFNPIIYVLLNNQFYRCFVAFLKCQTESQFSHIFNTSRVEDHQLAHSFHLHPIETSTLSEKQAFRPGALARTQIQPEHRTLILVVHYTP
ncbi:hypothetical protein GJAV_G00257410 [Gymnothorax javanicus]|nr:hypothetical protein GJAV_G00257410 [Gymnothorax javanicus]